MLLLLLMQSYFAHLEREARRNEFVAALEAIQISKDAEEDDGRP